MDNAELEKRADAFRADATDADEQWEIIRDATRRLVHHVANTMYRDFFIDGADYDEIHQIADITAWECTHRYRSKPDEYDTGYVCYLTAAVRNSIITRLHYSKCQLRDETGNVSMDQDRGDSGDTAHMRDMFGADDIAHERWLQNDSIYGFFRELDRHYPLTDIEKQVLACKLQGLTAREMRIRYGIGLRRQDNAWQRIRHKAEKYIANYMTDEDIDTLLN